MAEGKGRKSRKHGRNRAKCARYRVVAYKRNKIRRIKRHLKRCPRDEQSKGALERVERTVYTARPRPWS